MDDLIKRQDAIESVGFYSCHSGDKLLFADNALKNIQSVDAVEVVRCKDCIHFKHGNIRPNYCEVFDWSNEESDFCSFGERIDNA